MNYAGQTPLAVEAEDVVQGFQLLLGRDPDNEAIIEHHRRVSTSVWDLVRILISSQEYRRNAFKGAHLSVKKCFYEVYLAHSLPFDKRVICFLHSHHLIARLLREEISTKIFFDEIEIYRFENPELNLSITLQASQVNLSEGELCLTFKQHNRQLYTISFTIVPGDVVQKACDNAVLISRMQGTRGEHDSIRAVSKSLHDINPQAYLFSVLCGFCEAMNVSCIASVQAQNQIYFQQEHINVFTRNYDDFILSQGKSSTSCGYVVLDLPIQPKSLSLISSIHRLRTKKKRQFKEAIAQQAAGIVRGWFR